MRENADQNNSEYGHFSRSASVELVQLLEAALQRCSQEKVFVKYAANLQENSHAEVRFQ